MLDASIQWAEDYCHRVFRQFTHEAVSSSFENLVKHPPVTEITSLEYKLLVDGDYTAIDSTKYYLDDTTADILPSIGFYNSEDKPTVADIYDAVKFTYVGGYTAQTLPPNVRMGILQKLSSLYDNREEENKRFVTTAEMLLMPYKIFSL